LIVLGEGVNLFSMPLPRPFYGKTLAETEIGARTGLTVIALQRDEETTTHLTASTVLTPDTHLLMLGDTQQRRDFITLFGNGL
jgi:K+/H+ antiporter YhaU regulatory subunit KhtT